MARHASEAGRRAGSALVAVVLLVTAIALAIGIAEVATRLFDGLPLRSFRLPTDRLTIRQRSLVNVARSLPHADDVDPAWIDAEPPPLRNRGTPPRELLKLRRAAGDRVPLESALYRQWNRFWVESIGCPRGLLRELPLPLFVFDPPELNSQPMYRFPLHATLPDGLVTNTFGWRGPEIPLDKPPGTIRIAFVGASTTVGAHDLPFSYPEFVVHWLNLWAERAGLTARFDGINAGREGLISTSVAAIVRQEILDAEPDLVVYYEGANQFWFGELLDVKAARPMIFPKRPADGWEWLTAGLLPYSALARRLDRFHDRAAIGDGSEPPKPGSELRWPAGLDEYEPDVTRPDLPMQLSTIVADLESIRTALAGIGAELAVSSFMWMVADGMRVDPWRHAYMYYALNQQWWPLRYRDMRRMADFQNRVLARYAAAHDLLLIDLAAVVPADPELFADPIHFTGEGTRVQAWGVLNAILPRVRERLAAGAWPRPDRVPLRAHPGIHPPRRVPGCARWTTRSPAH